jgi:glycosyltransferase involved in cell wall biosynthesis
LKGHEVHLVAWTPGEAGSSTVTGVSGFAGWQGVHKVGRDHRDKATSDEQLIASALSTIRALEPDVIITGNLHGTGFPLDFARGLKTIDTLVVSYMHDCFWATGRCAYPVACQLYQTGCNETCPTPDEYPKLIPEKIAPAWRAKAAIFEGATGIPLVTNSGWTRDIAMRRYGDRVRVDCVSLAVDHELFAPIPKAVARRLLGLPAEGSFVVMGAVDILNKWKGGSLFRGIHAKLQARGDLSLLLFGESSTLLKAARSFGLVEDERLMPLILNSADVYVGTATEEAFGQTLLEASACGIPVVAFDRGGVSDIVVNEQTGILVKDLSVSELYSAIDRLLADPSLRDRFGQNARKRVETRFTLAKQADAWIEYLKTLSVVHHRSVGADGNAIQIHS